MKKEKPRVEASDLALSYLKEDQPEIKQSSIWEEESEVKPDPEMLVKTPKKKKKKKVKFF